LSSSLSLARRHFRNFDPEKGDVLGVGGDVVWLVRHPR